MGLSKRSSRRCGCLDERSPALSSPYMTSNEAATYLRLAGASSIRSLVQRGELHPVGRRGRRGPYLFTRDELDRWVATCLTNRSDASLAPRYESSGVGGDQTGGKHEKNASSGGPFTTPRWKVAPARHDDLPEDREAQGRRPNASRDCDAGRGSFTTSGSTTGTSAERRVTRDSGEASIRERLRAALARGQGRTGETGGGQALRGNPRQVRPAAPR